jgi:hypothetical protein
MEGVTQLFVVMVVQCGFVLIVHKQLLKESQVQGLSRIDLHQNQLKKLMDRLERWRLIRFAAAVCKTVELYARVGSNPTQRTITALWYLQKLSIREVVGSVAVPIPDSKLDQNRPGLIFMKTRVCYCGHYDRNHFWRERCLYAGDGLPQCSCKAFKFSGLIICWTWTEKVVDFFRKFLAVIRAK